MFLGVGVFVLVPVLMCNCLPAPGPGEPNVWGLRVFFAVFLAGPVLGPLVMACAHFTAVYLMLVVGVPVRAQLRFLEIPQEN